MIAWYVHHHGRGHVHRAATIAARLRAPVVGLSTLAAPAGWAGEWVRLPDDADGADPAADDPAAGGVLHWAPLGHRGLRTRVALATAVLTRPDVRLAVVDVSVEMSLLARLAGVPVVVVAQPGDRTDRPHRAAHDLAAGLLAPWPPDPQRPSPPRTTHVGALSRFDGRPLDRAPSPGGRSVLVLWGGGGVDVTTADLRAAAAATPGWRWTVAGPPPPGDHGEVTWLGWLADPWPALCSADVVVTHAGLNALAEVAAARRPAVVLPQARPHGEQTATADAVRRAGLAEVRDHWPEPAEWSALLAAATARGGSGWSRWSWGDGAARAAALLDGLAGTRS